jgi:hypothetical protein
MYCSGKLKILSLPLIGSTHPTILKTISPLVPPLIRGVRGVVQELSFAVFPIIKTISPLVPPLIRGVRGVVQELSFALFPFS